MRCVLVDERSRRVAAKELRHDEQTDILLAVKCLLQNVATVAVHRKLDDAAPNNE
jgi:hypothetical protein